MPTYTYTPLSSNTTIGVTLTSINAAFTTLYGVLNTLSFSSDSVLEGTSNLYWTNARFDTRLAATSLNAASLTGTIPDGAQSTNIAFLNGTRPFVGKVVFRAPNSTSASINLPPGTAPTSGSNGDLWGTSTGFQATVGAATRTFLLDNSPLASANLTGTIAPTVLTASVDPATLRLDSLNLLATAGAPSDLSWRVSTTTGLTFGYRGGTLQFGTVLSTIPANTIGLVDNTTNYVELDSTGTVSRNIVGFTAGRYRMATVVTSGGAIGPVTDARAFVNIPVSSAASISTTVTGLQALVVVPATGNASWSIPSGVTTYIIYQNKIPQTPVTDFTVTGSSGAGWTITFVAGNIPASYVPVEAQLVSTGAVTSANSHFTFYNGTGSRTVFPLPGNGQEEVVFLNKTTLQIRTTLALGSGTGDYYLDSLGNIVFFTAPASGTNNVALSCAIGALMSTDALTLQTHPASDFVLAASGVAYDSARLGGVAAASYATTASVTAAGYATTASVTAVAATAEELKHPSSIAPTYVTGNNRKIDNFVWGTQKVVYNWSTTNAYQLTSVQFYSPTSTLLYTYTPTYTGRRITAWTKA